MLKKYLFPAKIVAKKVRSTVYFNLKKAKAKSGDLWYEKELNFFLSRRCNARCPHCYLLQVNQNVFYSQDFSLEQVKNILNKYPNFKRINLSGGEALLNKDVIEIIKFCLSQKKELQILTNGIALIKYAEEIKDLKIENLHISLDANTAEEFAFKRGLNLKENNNIFSDITKSIKLITQAKPKKINKIGVSFILDKNNYNKIFEYIKFAETLNVDYIYFANFHSTDPNNKETSIFDEDKDITNILKEVSNKNNYTLDIHLPLLYGKNPGYYCYSLFSQLTVDPEGNLAPCCHIDPAENYGNIFQYIENKNAHSELPWNNDKIKSFRKMFLNGKQLPGICILCKNRYKYQLSFNKDLKRWYKSQQY